jgi:hypothetical protein
MRQDMITLITLANTKKFRVTKQEINVSRRISRKQTISKASNYHAVFGQEVLKGTPILLE